jgi:hypothetical protein
VARLTCRDGSRPGWELGSSSTAASCAGEHRAAACARGAKIAFFSDSAETRQYGARSVRDLVSSRGERPEQFDPALMERSSKDDSVVDVVFQLAARTVDRPDRILD